jgi:PAS domain S-box-containing protein
MTTSFTSATLTDSNPERFRLLVENSRDIVAEVALDGTIVYGSPNVESVLGHAVEELLQRSVFELVHPEDLAEVRKLFDTSAGWATCRGRHKDGTWRWIETSCRDFVSLEGEKRKVLVARDITERKQAEADRQRLEIQLMQAQKQSLLGTLTGGIAHDFNNVLTSIIGNADLARLTLEPQSPVLEFLDQVLLAGKRAQGMVQRLLAFGRGQPIEYQPMQLGPTILEVVDLLRPLLPRGIRIDVNLYDDSGWTVADATQVHQALMNVLINATQAMPQGQGLIEISSRQFSVPEGFSQLHDDLAAGPYLRLTVSDTGIGMDAETVNRIFNPYFTSKPSGQGTGLGLTVVQQVMKNHRGAVLVSSYVGKGSVFDLFFPQRKPEPPRSA